MTAELWKRRSGLKPFSRTSLWKGRFLMRSSVLLWHLLISRRATVPGLYLCGFFSPPVAGALLLGQKFAVAIGPLWAIFNLYIIPERQNNNSTTFCPFLRFLWFVLSKMLSFESRKKEILYINASTQPTLSISGSCFEVSPFSLNNLKKIIFLKKKKTNKLRSAIKPRLTFSAWLIDL